ncbi:unnamed protein product [Lupinus luteus]|uniref:Uncharacterized protein n=1 Tax=Lupinus luteus TaxID=3873 RepID=A0AAV1XH14_LUPLU
MKEVPKPVPMPKKKQVVEKVLQKSIENDLVINLEIYHNEEDVFAWQSTNDGLLCLKAAFSFSKQHANQQT